MRYLFLLLMLLGTASCRTTLKGSGASQAWGTVGNGSLVNGRKFALRGTHYWYISTLSHGLLGRAFVGGKAGSWRLEAGSWRLDAENWSLGRA